MTKTVIICLRPALYSLLAAEVSAWVFDRTLEAWTVRVLTTAAGSGYDLRAELAAQPAFDHLLLVGDLPVIQFWGSPDGHTGRLLHAVTHMVNRSVSIDNAREPGTDHCNLPMIFDTQPYAAVAWLTFEGLAGVDATEQYRKWFARRHTYSVEGAKAFPVMSQCLDHFGYGFEIVAKSMFAKFPKAFHGFMPTAPNGDDGQLHKQEPALTYTVMSGGENFGDGQYLWYWGRYADLMQYPMQTLHCGFYGSHTCEWTYNGGSIIRAALVDKAGASLGVKAITSIYNHEGDFRYDIVLDGGTFGEAATATTAQIGWPLGIICGDPTVVFDAETLARLARNEQGAEVTEAEFNAYKAVLETWRTVTDDRLKKLEAGGTGDTGGAVVILSAKYRQVADHDTYKVCTAVVQALVDAGKPFYVYSETAPCLSDPSWGVKPKDPYPGIEKELVVTYTKSGFTWGPTVFGQWAQVTL